MATRWKSILVTTALIALITAVGTAVQAAEFKTGTYSVTGGGAKWSIKFGDNNKLTVTLDGKVLVEGSYKVTADAIELVDEKGPMACGGDLSTGKYKWKLEEKKLTLTKVEDECEGRANALTAQPWLQE